MVAFKAAQTAAFLKSPDPKFSAVLLYGPDSGLVADRGAQLAELTARQSAPEGEIVRIDDRDLAEDADRLAVETQTLPMFGGRKVVRLRAGQRLDAGAVAGLLEGPLEAFLIVEAGNLRPGTKLRKTFESSPSAAALPCYSEPERDIAALIDEEFARHGLRIADDARRHLIAQLGADLAEARSEIAKLAIYAGDAKEVELDDVTAIVDDSSQAGLDMLCNAVAQGEAVTALAQSDRLVAMGQDVQRLLSALGRHFGRLHRVSAQVESGETIRSALQALRPPLHFKQHDAMTAQVRRWTRADAAHAIAAIQETTQSSRLTPDLVRALSERLLLMLSRLPEDRASTERTRARRPRA